MDIEIPADTKTVTLELKKHCTFTLRSLLPNIGSEVELIIEDVFDEDRFTVKDHDLYRLRGSNGSMLMRTLARSRILPGEAYLDLTPRLKLRGPQVSLYNGTVDTVTGTGCIELWVRLTKRPGEED